MVLHSKDRLALLYYYRPNCNHEFSENLAFLMRPDHKFSDFWPQKTYSPTDYIIQFKLSRYVQRVINIGNNAGFLDMLLLSSVFLNSKTDGMYVPVYQNHPNSISHQATPQIIDLSKVTCHNLCCMPA